MKSFLTISVVLLLTVSAFAQGVVVLSYGFGKKYSCEIPHDKLAKSPPWKQTADSPPLPAGKAIRLANAVKSRLVKDSHDFKWSLASATLEHIHSFGPWPLPDGSDLRDRWWWAIKYEAYPRKGGTSGVPDLIVVVLMDGTVIEPKVSDEN
jgi:hypothetical protein